MTPSSNVDKIRSPNRHIERNKYNYVLMAIPIFIFLFLLYEYVFTRYYHLIPSLLYFATPVLMGFLIVLVLTPICIFVAKKSNIIDESVKDGQKVSTPLLGGVSIYIAFIAVTCLFDPAPAQTKSILIGASIIFILGTIDDIYPLSSTIRLFGQIAASFVVMASGLIVSFMPDNIFGTIMACLITLFWILGVVNATNFTDGIDGLATGIGVIASTFFFLITLHLGQFHVSLLAAVLAGCGLGFLIFNFKPAKIYLGDGGSTFLGFVLACFALYGGWSSKGPIIALGIPMLILGVLIFDMIYITISRIKNGHVKNFREWLDFTGRDHFHHRLLNIGFREEFAVLFIYITCIILGLSALVLENARLSYPVVVMLIQATLIFINISILMLIGRQLSNGSNPFREEGK